MIDPRKITRDLVRRASVTPADNGALAVVEAVLASGGFECTRVDRNGICNLFARWGQKGHPKTFGFNGHTDVVPIGDETAWTFPPFGAEEKDGWLYGRGATDMKSGVAAFAAAAVEFVNETPPDGAVILAITGDEEADAFDGTLALLDWMQANEEAMTDCLVGEPTCPNVMGEMIKIGRRGSMTVWFTLRGKQGHSAYLHRTLNPLPAVALLAHRLSTHKLDDGTDHFVPSTFAVTTIDTGNTATNVIPAETKMTANLRFNDEHSGASLTAWLQAEADKVASETGVKIEMRVKVSGEAFVTAPGPLSALVAGAVEAETGVVPELSTTGGTSDARFVKSHCPVVEFGLVGHRMHEVDERVWLEDIDTLKRVYCRILTDYFA